MTKTYIIADGIRVTRTLRDIARSIACKECCTEEAAYLFFEGAVLEDWKCQCRDEADTETTASRP